ncbi:hypothetical protein GGI07_005017 [Coemansia sp. Benny D115]|nr:hypothetical protein GGI07_005017 [Coemansia sp. Benny D115]
MSVNNVKLNNGVLMPEIGLGTWKANEEGVLRETVKKAVAMGYRHIDCAKIYGNQTEIGKALAEISVPRKELFIVSKIWQNRHRPERVEEGLDEILKELQLDYLDLLLIHWPHAYKPESRCSSLVPPEDEKDDVPIMDTWRAMEKLVESGKVLSIGVSNFNQAILQAMIPQCQIVPAVNQVEIHPFNQSTRLVEFCKQNGIVVTGYCPLGGTKVTVMEDSTITSIASKHSCTPAQVALSWSLEHGVVVIPKSTNEDRLKQNLQRVALTADDMRQIDDISLHERKVDPARDSKDLEWIFHEDKARCPLI